jgi:hypothetical protein
LSLLQTDHPGPNVDIAAATVARAVQFLRLQADQSWLRQTWHDQDRLIRSRLVGNWLGELDRLLHVLLDARGFSNGEGPSPQIRNTISKLTATCDGTDWCRPHLLGLTRAHAAFRYTNGCASRPDERGGTVSTLGWIARDGAWAMARVGQIIQFDGYALLKVCGFYEDLAASIVARR